MKWLTLIFGIIAVGFGGYLLLRAPEETILVEAETPVITSALDLSYPTEVPTGQLPEGVRPTRYMLDLTIDPLQERFQGHVEIQIETDLALSHFYFHGEELAINEISVLAEDGTAYGATYEQVEKDGVARLDLEGMLPAGQHTLSIAYDAAFSSELDGLYKVEENGEQYVTSQLQTISARRAFPSFDEPRFKVPFEISITAPEGQTVVGNTPVISEEPAGDGRVRHQFNVSKPLPTYLLAFLVGPYDVLEWEPIAANAYRAEPIPLRAIATKGNGHKAKYLLSSTGTMVRFFEEYFDMAYPYAKLDLVAVPDYAFGAMENAGTIVFREQYVLQDESTPQSTRYYSVLVNSHEISHQWFGDLVTPKWWNDAWLNESFATWAASKGAHAWEPTWGYDTRTQSRSMSVMVKDRRPSARPVRAQINSNHDIVNAFDGISYSKGSGVLHMFEKFIGEEDFREGVRLHMKRHAFGVADYNDFVQSLADGTGRPELIEAFDSFILQSGVPTIDLAVECSAIGARLKASQSRYVALGVTPPALQEWKIPICYRADGQKSCALLDAAEKEFDLGHACPDVLMPNVEADGYYQWTLDDHSLANLIAEFDQLSAIESESVASNLDSWFAAGQVSFENVVALSRVMAKSQNPIVAKAPLGILTEVDRRLVSEDRKMEMVGLVRDIYGDWLDVLGLWPNTAVDRENSRGARVFRYYLLKYMAFEARDADLRAALTQMGEAAIGYGGVDETPESVNSSLRDLALQVAMEENGRLFADAMVDTLRLSTVGTIRSDIIDALAASEDLDLKQFLLDEVIMSEWVRHNETIQFAQGLVDNEVQHSLTWEWLKEDDHIDQIAMRLPNFARGRVAALGNEVCTAAERDDYEAFIKTKFDVIDGAPRVVAEQLELINQCIALTKTKSDEVAMYLGKNF